MLDPEEFAAFEAWKADKIAGSINLGLQVFNSERESLAVAWEAGVKFAVEVLTPIIEMSTGPVTPRRVQGITNQNPHRKPGRTGAMY